VGDNRIGDFDLCEETVAAAGNRFHKAGAAGGVAQGLADFVYGFVEPVVEIHESVCGPNLLLKFLSAHHLPSVLQKHDQHSERLFLKFDPQTILAQFAAAEINLEDPEADTSGKMMVFWHGEKIC
jgi:hypothetical protein